MTYSEVNRKALEWLQENQDEILDLIDDRCGFGRASTVEALHNFVRALACPENTIFWWAHMLSVIYFVDINDTRDYPWCITEHVQKTFPPNFSHLTSV